MAPHGPIPKSLNITDKVAVITGGASGLGHATAQAIVAKGGKVMILDLNEEQGLAVAAELGDNAAFVKTDVTDEASVQAAIAATWTSSVLSTWRFVQVLALP